ncbi:MAG: hypothetical protein U1E65_31015 [Myxococcota bacterium]
MAESLAVHFGSLATVANPGTANGRQAQDLLGGDYGALRNRISNSREIPADAKACMTGAIDAANQAMTTAVSDGTITPTERQDLVTRALSLGQRADGVVRAQNASPNAPVPGDTYRAILCK